MSRFDKRAAETVKNNLMQEIKSIWHQVAVQVLNVKKVIYGSCMKQNQLNEKYFKLLYFKIIVFALTYFKCTFSYSEF